MQEQLESKIQITLAHLSMPGQCHPYFYWSMHILGAIQIMSMVVDSHSAIYALFFWGQPSRYLSSSALSLFATLFAFLLILMIAARYYSTEDSLPLAKASLTLSYLDRILQYTQLLGRSILIVPFMRAILLQFKQPTAHQFLVLSSISIALYLVILYPLLLYTSLGSGALTPHFDNKINFLNAELILNIFKIILPVTSVYSSTATLVFSSFFVFFFLFAIVKRPVFSYSYNKFKASLISIVCFACLFQISGAIQGKLQGDISTEILGMICFPALIEVISRNRIKSLIKEDKKSVYQLKLMLFMIGQIEYYRELLDLYIIKHQKQCRHVGCKCRNLVDVLASKDTQQNQDIAWYEFLAVFIENTFDLAEIVKLPKSEMVACTSKYSSVVFELAEVHIFQLKNLNKANTLLEKYRIHLLQNGLAQQWSSRRYKIVMYYLQQAILERVKTSTAINVYANKFVHFQAEFIKYLDLLLATARKATDIWAELAKPEPTESILSQSIDYFQRAEIKIRQAYHSITQNYEGSSRIVDPITRDFYQMVYNIQESDPFHVIPYSQFAPPKKVDKKARLNENLRIFSYDSETPMFFFSVLPQSFGKIQKSNSFFDGLMFAELGQVRSIDQLILPELRETYLQSLRNAILGDTLTLPGSETFVTGSKLQLLPAEYMIQVVPSIGKSLKYAFFLKKYLPEKSMFILKDGQSIPYRSKAFDKLIDVDSFLPQVITALKKQSNHDFKQNQQFLLQIAGEQMNLTLLQSFRHADSIFQCFSLAKDSNNFADMESKMMCTKHPQINLESVSDIKNNKKSVKFIDVSQKDVIKEQEPDQQGQNQEGKVKKAIKELYGILLNQNIGRKIRLRLNLVIFCGCLIVIGLLFACILTKINQKKNYQALADAYEALKNIMITIGDVTTDLKLLNLYYYQNMSTEAVYKRLVNYPSISDLMDTAFSFYSYEDYNQDWGFLKLNESGSMTAGTLRNYNTLTDYLELPLTNLQTTNASSFNFSFSLAYLQPPLNSTQIFFHEFITNALYFALPNLRQLSTNILKPILRQRESPSSKITIFCSIIIATIVLSLLLLIWLQRRFFLIMKSTHRFIQAVDHQLINLKKEQCIAFVNKYRPTLLEDNQPSEKTLPARPQASHEALMSNNTSRFSNLSERELDIRSPISPEAQPYNFQEQLQVIGRPLQVQSRKREIIFGDSPYCKLAAIYIVPAFIFLSFAVVFIVLSQSQSGFINSMMYLFNGIGYTLEDLVLIHTYSLHFGVYDYRLQTYQNIPQYLATLIYEMFYILQLILTSIGSSISSKSKVYWQSIGYNNLCQLEQQGLFDTSPYHFEQRGSFAYCTSVANGILAKGFIAAMLSYLEKANNLFLANPATVMYTPQQKLAYLNDPFFTDTVRLLDYFKLILAKSMLIMRQDLNDLVNSANNILIYSSIALILGLVMFLLLIRPIFLARFNSNLTHIRGFFLLVSQQTAYRQPNLRLHLTAHLEQLKELK